MLRPVVLYKSEESPLRKTEEIGSAVYERKVRRQIFGPCKDARIEKWRIKRKRRIQDSLKLAFLLKKWNGEDVIIRNVIEKNSARKRRLGRIRVGRKNCVVGNVCAMKPVVQRWEAVEDRNRWRYIYLEEWC